jgi:hypothetical protein
VTVAEKQHGRHKPNPRYEANVREYARRLAAQNGWTAYRIRRALIGRIDPLPSEATIRNWIDPDRYEEQLRRERKFRPSGVSAKRGWQLRLERMRELREGAELSASATARVMCLDYGLDLNRWQVEDLLNGRVKKHQTFRKHLYPQGTK